MDIFHCQTVRRAKMKHLVLIVGCLSSLVGYIQSAPAVIWYAPFLSGGGYCSEAHSFVRGIVNTLKTPLVIESTTFSTSTTSPGDLSKTKEDISLSSSTDFSNDGNEDKDGENTKKQEEENPPFSLYVTQHGDSINPTFLKDLPGDMETLLEEHWIEERDFQWRLKKDKIAIAICHSEPGAWSPALYSTSRCPPYGSQYKVGRTMFETDRVPSGWPPRLNAMNEIWVPTRFQRKVFVDGGVDKDKIKIIPEAVDVEFFDPKTVDPYEFPSTLGIKEDTIVYLSIFKWEERKAWRILLKAYFQAFQPEENVILVILTNAYHVEQQTAADFRRLVQEFATKEFNKLLKALPKVYILPPNLPQDEMPSLYKAATAFVLPSRGEGWGRPHVEAMAMELPIIATFWSGTTEYMTESNSYPLRIDGLVEIEEGAFKGHKWAEPSVQHLKELLLHVKYNPKEAKEKGKQARQDMVSKYSPEAVGKTLRWHIDRILESLGYGPDNNGNEEDDPTVLSDVHEEL